MKCRRYQLRDKIRRDGLENPIRPRNPTSRHAWRERYWAGGRPNAEFHLPESRKYLIGLSERKPATEAPRAADAGRQFSDQARRIGSSHGPNDRKLLAGSIRLLDLDEIKRELGVNWGQASAAAYRMVEDRSGGILPRTTSMQTRQDMFVLCFASADREIVEARMRDIAEEIKCAFSSGQSETFHVAHDAAAVTLRGIATKPRSSTQLRIR